MASKKSTDFQTLTFKKNGETVKILISSYDDYNSYKEGKLSIDKVLLEDQIFSDNSGDVCSDEVIEKVTGTSNRAEACMYILDNGDIKMTVALRNRLIEEKKEQVFSIILQNYVDSRTKAPVNKQQLEAAIKQSNAEKVFAELNRDANYITKELVEKIYRHYPIRSEILEVIVGVGLAFTGNIQKTIISKYSMSPSRENWGSRYYTFITPIRPKQFDEVAADLNKLTKGEFTLEIIESETMKTGVTADDVTKRPKKNKK